MQLVFISGVEHFFCSFRCPGIYICVHKNNTMLNQDASRIIGVKPVACFEIRTAILQNLHDPPKNHDISNL